jgi:DNA recombination protein RmuC
MAIDPFSLLIFILLLIVIALLLKRGNITREVEGAVVRSLQNSSGMFEAVFSSAISKNVNTLEGAFAKSMKQLGLQEDMGVLKNTTRELKDLTTDLKTMFAVKHQRARFGELQLEGLLKDLFPHTRLKFQHNIPGCGTPDACIMVDETHYLCIDSKFPLENLKRYGEARGEEKDQYWDAFLRDVYRHIDDVRKKYVSRGNTLDFAFMFVPSDLIYFKIASESSEVLVEAAKSGVIMVSPSILPAYLSLVSAKIKAEEISEKAEEIQNKIDGMSKHMEELDTALERAYRQIGHANTNMGRAMNAFQNMKNYFSSITSLKGDKE